MFKPLIHFELIFENAVRQTSSFILVHVAIQFPSTIYWKYHPFPIDNSYFFVKYSLTYMLGFISGLSVWFHSFLCLYHTVLIIITLYYSFKLGCLMLPVLLFFLRIALAISGLLKLHRKFTIYIISVKISIGILKGIA